MADAGARGILRRMQRLVGLIVLVGCSSPSGPKTSTVVSDDAPTRWEDLVYFVTQHTYRNDPATAVGLGVHDFDGQLPDRSPKALENMTAQLRKDQAALEAATDLKPAQKFERDVLLFSIRSELFNIVERDIYRRNPMTYTGAINLDAYIIRDYAPMVVRAAAVIKLCTALPAYLAQARANLQLPIPRTWIDTALLQTKGMVEFADKDVRNELTKKVDIPLANQADIDPALDTCKAALAEHAAWLEKQQPHGTNDFALGPTKFLAMLRETQGVDIDAKMLTAIADEDLRRNLAAIEEAARAIDPKRSTVAVVEELANVKPDASEVIAFAAKQAEEMRAFVVANEIVSIPTQDVAVVKESPPFQRWNAAFLDRPGPFEQKALPSYYYISPPDPKWPPAEQRAYIPPKDDLLFTTVHEVWPGHFLHGLHIAKNPSRVLQAHCTYSNSEGWAHYTEEMMFDAGVGQQTPQARIGMLKEALLRNVRFVATIGLHTRGMTVDEAQKLFATKGFVDAGNARQQAVRGTFDPMYLAYTLGKIMIRNLKTEWMKANPGKSMRDFHDTLLSYACAPLPLIRRAMLGDAATGSGL
jgi:uncharacterized protein (DUF885 family)